MAYFSEEHNELFLTPAEEDALERATWRANRIRELEERNAELREALDKLRDTRPYDYQRHDSLSNRFEANEGEIEHLSDPTT